MAILSATGQGLGSLFKKAIPRVLQLWSSEDHCSNEVSRQNYKAYSILAFGGIGYVGVDGTFDEDDEIDELPLVEVRIGKVISRMGPSVLLSASCETVAFALGAIVGMPAGQNFCNLCCWGSDDQYNTSNDYIVKECKLFIGPFSYIWRK
ncbi:hypothetical protein PPACK8108_LOCUS7796 [Phakopsora pachyrhizi]|uniref:SSD domain-containing protein n=1 Tax=Phakopsora pachyrhizi TaxID=170000 RepID=A0AAV0ATM2_PHAPC|nr:hypothetical protein PPACK8108_LOCUS7796 [Phakopsora pachyrhizi]